MVKIYDTYFGDAKIGQVRLRKQGLYYCIDGDFERCTKSICRLIGSNGKEHMDLGVCVPCENRLILKRSIPIKNITFDIAKWALVEQSKMPEENFIPVKNDEPFGCIKDLKNAKWWSNGDAYGIILEQVTDLN